MNLKPCPFCGKPAFLFVHKEVGIPNGQNGYGAITTCTNAPECGAMVKVWALEKEWAVSSATEAWNRRLIDG